MKIIYIIVTLLCVQYTTAQNNELFVFYNGGNVGTNSVLHHDVTTDQLTVAPKENNTYFDAFIIRPSFDYENHTVYLISAKENNMFLKRNGNALEFEDIQNAGGTLERAQFEWEIQYVGFPYIAISDPENSRNVIYIENNALTMKVVPDAEWNLSNNTDGKGNAYRYQMSTITNTF